jgi:hypothetical protein
MFHAIIIKGCQGFVADGFYLKAATLMPDKQNLFS